MLFRVSASLSPAEARVATAVLGDPRGAAAQTITQLARGSGTSEATVLRVLRSADLRGCADLRIALAAEAARTQPVDGGAPIGSDIGADDDLARVVETPAARSTRSKRSGRPTAATGPRWR
jgi:DNA-binding MurR/RpiR family transcriptional regulator